MSRDLRAATALGMTSALLFWGAPAAAKCTLGYVTETPMRQQGSALVIDATVNGRVVPLKLTTDHRYPYFSDSTAGPLRMVRDLQIGSHVGGDTIHTPRGRGDEVLMRVHEIRIGAAPESDIPVYVLPRPDNPAVLDAADSLGMRALDRFDVDIDVLGRRLILYAARGDCAKPAVALGGELYIAPMQPTNWTVYYGSDVREPEDPEPVLTAVVAGHKLDTEIAVSRAHSWISRSAASRLGLSVQPLAAGQAEPGERSITSIGPVSIGELTIPHLPLRVVDELPSVDAYPSAYRDLNLGADLLRHTHIWISNSSRTVVFQLPPAPSPPAPAQAAATK